jgi:hypothetical protein
VRMSTREWKPEPDVQAVAADVKKPAISYLKEDYAAFRERVSAQPPPTDHVAGLIPDEGVLLWHGPPRTTKTLSYEEVAFKLACGVAPFNNRRFAVKRPVKVAYVTEEDSERRTNHRFGLIDAGATTHRGQMAMHPPVVLPPGTLFPLVRQGFTLDAATDRELLLKDLGDLGIEVAIFEPIRSLTGLAEKTAAEFKPIQDWMRRVQRETTCKTFGFGHHWRKNSAKSASEQNAEELSNMASGGALFSISDCLVAFQKMDWNRALLIPGSYKNGADPESFEVLWETDERRGPSGEPLFGTWIRAVATTKARERVVEDDDVRKILAWLPTHPWMTAAEIESGARLRKDKQEGGALVALGKLVSDGRVEMVTGEDAKNMGRSPKAKLYAITGAPKLPGDM